MLYKIKKEGNNFRELEPLGFSDFQDFGKKEKDLENLISENLLEQLFENNSLMPIFQERQRQPEADIYALNSEGDLIIFELKRSTAFEDAVSQVLRYCQEAGRWPYWKLNELYQKFINPNSSLKDAHKIAFDLEEPLLENEFNQKQELFVIGSAADKSLIEAIDYWKRSGINIDFLPYRIYKIGNDEYFEFFSKPYDTHVNPHYLKGVLFDTCQSWDKNAIWDMMDNSYVAAYGNIKHVVNFIKPNDYVFLSHTGYGIVGAGIVKSDVQKDNETWYRKLEFLTPRQSRNNELQYMPFSKVKEVLEKNFYWAKTIKVPYFTVDESKKLLAELNTYIK